MTATYNGGDASSRIFTAKLAASTGTLVIVYVEALSGDQAALSAISKPIFDSIALNAQ